MQLTEIESAALRMLLAGDHPVLNSLRNQLTHAVLVSREVSDAGFNTYFRVPDSVARHSGGGKVILSDVYATITGLESPASFLLFTNNGMLDLLECNITDLVWPRDGKLVEIYYMAQPDFDNAKGGPLKRVEQRDMREVLRYVAV